jgi:tetrahydromethanopterin S-methyltransferase subunit A
MPLPKNPIRMTFCCARVVSGHVAAAPPRSVIDKTIKKMERLLGASGANLGLYSGYSYNPLA